MNASSDNLNVLHRNDLGYVARCRCCSEVQVAIGTLVAHMELSSFLSFYKTLQMVSRDPDSYVSSTPDGDKILLRTPVRNMLMSFTIEEFAKTLQLFAQAWVLIEANAVANNVK